MLLYPLEVFSIDKHTVQSQGISSKASEGFTLDGNTHLVAPTIPLYIKILNEKMSHLLSEAMGPSGR